LCASRGFTFFHALLKCTWFIVSWSDASGAFSSAAQNDRLSGDVFPLDFSSAKIARFLVAVLAVQSDVTSGRVSMNETMSLKEAARYLKLSQEALRRKAKAGVIPGAKLGKSWVFYQPDLVEYLRSRYPRLVGPLHDPRRRASTPIYWDYEKGRSPGVPRPPQSGNLENPEARQEAPADVGAGGGTLAQGEGPQGQLGRG
jgi:excisionase family DNA binding protein